MTEIAGLIFGLFGGAGATLVWELLLRPRREQRSIAEILAAEVSLNIQIIGAMMVRADPKRIPADFHLSTYVFDAVVSRVGELPTNDVGDVVLLYNHFHELNRKAHTFWQTVDTLRELAADSPHRQTVIAELDSVISTFYGSLDRAAGRVNLVQPRLLRTARPSWSFRRSGKKTESLDLLDVKARADESDARRARLMDQLRKPNDE